MAFTAKDVQALRERTGAGMMDCKKALTETDGDMEKAVDFLREKGLAAQAKKAGRIAAEGVVFATVDTAAKVGAVVEVNAETDFVSKNPDFIAFVESVAAAVIKYNPADVEALLPLPCAGYGSVEEALRDKIFIIGENMKIRRFIRYEGDCAAYVHGGGRIGVLVKFSADATTAGGAALAECGKDVAMQIAALNPLYLDEAAVPAEDIAREREVLIAQIKNDPKLADKPANIIDKMVDGRIGKFYENNCLLKQAFVKNGDITVAQYVADCAKAAGGAFSIACFTRFEKGEGLAKREENFADEVANMIK
ncbi:MAG: translation elongation factor Ts [Oscillospiraceae bacterium]|nr:translation elongation factor Ts [Oscillospiraceae bacterium]